jgi:hypothetical protein
MLESWAPERTGCLQAVAICNIINGAEEWPSKHCPIAQGCKARGPSGSEKNVGLGLAACNCIRAISAARLLAVERSK